MLTRSFTEEEADRINQAIVPVRSVERVDDYVDEGMLSQGALLVRIDTEQRPHLRDLMRMLNYTALQRCAVLPAIYDPILGQEALIQYVARSDSADGDITIILSWREHEQALRYLAKAPMLLICTSDEHDIAGHSIRIPLHEDDLHRAIATWERRTGLHDCWSPRRHMRS